MATVLVVDDEPDIRFFVQLNLELDGHTVVTAAGGEEALAAVRAQRPDVILLDVMMPGIDGWTVLESLKANLDESIKTVPVVMVTSLGADRDKIRGGIEGAVRYLVKPVTPDELTAAITAALDGEPEPVQRRGVQRSALQRLARIEAEEAGTATDGNGPRLRLSRLEPGRGGRAVAPGPEVVDGLTDKQVALLRCLRDTTSVSAAAAELGVSRSNIYASLRRITRKLGIDDVRDLLERVRGGTLVLTEHR